MTLSTCFSVKADFLLNIVLSILLENARSSLIIPKSLKVIALLVLIRGVWIRISASLSMYRFFPAWAIIVAAEATWPWQKVVTGMLREKIEINS